MREVVYLIPEFFHLWTQAVFHHIKHEGPALSSLQLSATHQLRWNPEQFVSWRFERIICSRNRGSFISSKAARVAAGKVAIVSLHVFPCSTQVFCLTSKNETGNKVCDIRAATGGEHNERPSHLESIWHIVRGPVERHNSLSPERRRLPRQVGTFPAYERHHAAPERAI